MRYLWQLIFVQIKTRNAIPIFGLVNSFKKSILDLAEISENLWKFAFILQWVLVFAWHRRYLDQRWYYKSNYVSKRGILRNNTMSFCSDLHSFQQNTKNVVLSCLRIDVFIIFGFMTKGSCQLHALDYLQNNFRTRKNTWTVTW